MCRQFIVLLLVFICQISSAKNLKLDSVIQVLDQTLVDKDIYVKQKEQRISELKKILELSNILPEQRYDVNIKIYEEYKLYMTDSAVVYAEKNIPIAKSLNNKDLINDSKINLATIYTITGMYIEAQRLFDSIDSKTLPLRLRTKYYDSYKQLFHHYPAGANSISNYNAYRDSLLSILDKESNEYKIIFSEKLTDAGQYEEVRKLLLPMYSESEETHWNSVLAYAIGNTYKKESNYDMQKKYYAISSIYDIKNVIKENASLLALAISLYETGDIDRSHKYIQSSLEDANLSNGHLRAMEVSQIFPIIEKSYQHKIAEQKDRFFYLFVCIGILSVFLILAIIYVYFQLKKIRKAKRALSDVNKQLHDLNKDLHDTNKKMGDINKQLFESDLLKETYITQFLDMCHRYISKIESYQNMLNKKAMDRKLDDLYRILKSREMVDNELKELYEIFDNVFLHLYPNFVEEFNNLLLPDEQFVLKPNEQLNPELRIFALIRLGITDSSKIASFLRYSPTTIYSYRTRVRNKSAVPRDEFEQRVMKIGLILN